MLKGTAARAWDSVDTVSFFAAIVRVLPPDVDRTVPSMNVGSRGALVKSSKNVRAVTLRIPPLTPSGTLRRAASRRYHTATPPHTPSPTALVIVRPPSYTERAVETQYSFRR